MAARVGAPSGAPVPSFRYANPALGRRPLLAWEVAVVDRNEGASDMAGSTLGARSPAPFPAMTAAESRPHSRTRRNHGAFTLGGLLACVYSTRRSGQERGVSFELGGAELLLRGSLTPLQARHLAQALGAAAEAAEAAAGGST